MKKILFALLVLLSFQLTAQKSAVIHDNNAQIRNVGSSFTAIKVSSAIDLYLTQSSNNQVAVSATPGAWRLCAAPRMGQAGNRRFPLSSRDLRGNP